MRPVWLVLGFVWAIPTTVVGLVAGLLTFQGPRIPGGALVFDRGGPWFIPAYPAGRPRTSCRRGPMERQARRPGENP